MHYSGYYSPSGLSTTSTLWLKQGIFVWQLSLAVVGGGGRALHSSPVSVSTMFAILLHSNKIFCLIQQVNEKYQTHFLSVRVWAACGITLFRSRKVGEDSEHT